MKTLKYSKGTAYIFSFSYFFPKHYFNKLLAHGEVKESLNIKKFPHSHSLKSSSICFYIHNLMWSSFTEIVP